MSTLPEPGSFNPYLPDVYRFAFLMTGEAAAAAAVLRRTVERATRGGIGDLRDARRVKRWLFTEARHLCAQGGSAAHAPPTADTTGHLETNDTDLPVPAQLAARFAGVPEAERGALILFYLYLFDPADLAEVLEVPPAGLAPLLTRGREFLGQSP